VLGVVAAGWVLYFRRRLFDSAWFLVLCQWVAPLGFIAVLAGWITTETGRQPWTVYGLMRTADSVSPSLTGGDVLTSLIAYMLVYLIMFPAGIAFMGGLVRAGVRVTDAPDKPVEGFQHQHPLQTPAAE
jgi:cytochrome d ubiquinol oxidase subunit I